jgi:Tfp pilus assembly protein PilF
MALVNFGLSLLKAQNHVQAQAVLTESLALYRALEDLEGTALALDGLAMAALCEGDHKRASSLLEEALALARRVGHVLDAGGYLADLEWSPCTRMTRGAR